MEQETAGFTLVELLVVIAVMGILAAGVNNAFVSGWQLWQYNQQKLSYKTEERIILNRLQRDLKRTVELEIQNSAPLDVLLLKITTSGDKAPEKCLRYAVDNKRFKRWTVSTWGGNWPNDWGTGTELTREMIVEVNYNYQQSAQLLEVEIGLAKDETSGATEYKRRDQIYLRLAE